MRAKLLKEHRDCFEEDRKHLCVKYAKTFATLALGMMVTLVAVDFAEARRASAASAAVARAPSSSRDHHPHGTDPGCSDRADDDPAHHCDPAGCGPVDGANQAARPGGLFGGLAGGLMGGLLLGGLFGMLMGTGFVGGISASSPDLAGPVVSSPDRFAMRMFANRQAPPASAQLWPRFGGFGGMARDNQSVTSRVRASISRRSAAVLRPSAAASRSGPADELGITPKDLEALRGTAEGDAGAYAAEDYGALPGRITNAGAMYLSRRRAQRKRHQGVKNEVRDVHLVQGDVAESWAEEKMEYATVAMRYEAVGMSSTVRAAPSSRAIEHAVRVGRNLDLRPPSLYPVADCGDPERQLIFSVLM